MRALVFILVLCAVAACATVPRPPGERLYLSKCGACHKRPDRGSFNSAEWKEVLEAHRNRFPLTEEEKSMLSEYLAGEGGK